MNIISISILRLPFVADAIYVNTDLPEASFPYTERLSLRFICARGEAEKYCAEHFPGIPITMEGR